MLPSNEMSEEQKVGGEDSTRESTLGNSVFNDPKEFLQILKDHHAEITQRRSEYATKQDFFYASEHASDPKLRAAAKIAFNHFDEINAFDNVTKNDGFTGIPAIGKLDYERGLNYLSGNYKSDLYWQQAKNIGGTVGWAALTAAMGTLTAVSVEIPPLAALMGLGATTMGGITGLYGYDAYNYPSMMHQRAADTKSRLSSWPEINKHLRK